MDKIKILQIGMSDNQGGIETYLYNMFCNADKEKFEFDFIDISNTKIAFGDELIRNGANVHKVISRTKNYIKHIKKLKEIMKKNNYDIIHINIMDYSWFEPILIANKHSKARIILHSHNANSSNTWSKKHLILHKLGKKMCKKIDAEYVACGEAAGKWMFDGKEFQIFNNGININKFGFNQNNRDEVRRNLGIDNKETIIGQVAKLEIQKNPLFLIEIFKEYQKLNSNSKLLIVGEGSLKTKVKLMIKEYNLENKVILLGKRDDTYKIYSAFDIFLMPSLYEGLSIALIEAQVNGLKCYTSVNVDKKSDISGNVEFLDLDQGAKYCARHIFKNINLRDGNVKNKIPNEFNDVTSYDKVYNFYKDIVNK